MSVLLNIKKNRGEFRWCRHYISMHCCGAHARIAIYEFTFISVAQPTSRLPGTSLAPEDVTTLTQH